MRFSDIEKGKKYIRQHVEQYKNGRAEKKAIEYVYLIVDKEQDGEMVLASVVPDVGKPTAPAWYGKSIWQRWKPKN